MKTYDVIVIGAGHAGIEAALAAARMGCSTLMANLNLDTIGYMSCNPAIGGVGKGQLVKEIDALGGEMARAADACGMQFRILNASKGPAVQSSRAQIDRQLYLDYMSGIVRSQPNLELKKCEVTALLLDDKRVVGIRTAENEEILSRCVVICPGTFLKGLLHVGLTHFPGGRMGEPASQGLAEQLQQRGFVLLGFKTGTCPRLDAGTIDYSRLTVQDGDVPPKPFSFTTRELPRQQVPCHITYTNKNTHQIIRDNLARSPLYAGVIKSTGVRYCPSIEDKIVKFSDKERHQVFLEPEGYTSPQVYPNGMSTSLPEEVQLSMVRSVEGLQEAKILVFGYGIEHAVVEPTQLYPTLETKLIGNLYLAGQINGTTGYEEAAAQGLVAGMNAALRAQGRESFILDRASSYIGVLIDDLTTKGTTEPYRMFTSRVEYRLIIREDNADLRLTEAGYQAGLVPAQRYELVKKKARMISRARVLLKTTFVKPQAQVNQLLESARSACLRKKTSLEDLLRRPQLNFGHIRALSAAAQEIPEFASQQAEIEVKYSGFIQRQLKEVERFQHLEKIRLPADLDYAAVPGVSREIKEKLKKFRPINLGQASRISGITPAAVSILMVYLRKISGAQAKRSA
ncbi:MAG TPA: tRNA uridine-5-carboxymethylaminomethyl(34) synthesis enzyme MnmG [Candidatus Omnitrophota bacterium]|nr:tRNA uridine-5-carboxymethylaminomethyl(34) synthesis enzyme MnmG [Candidatus Omnitrophota bacterium]